MHNIASMPSRLARQLSACRRSDIEGKRIKLTKSDPASGGQHHYIDMDMVDEIRGGVVCLSKSADEARRTWQ
jgi:hypothetical protein